MKIKKSVLKQIIAEEKKKLLSEGISEAGPGIMGKVKKAAIGVGAAAALGGASIGVDALKKNAQENATRTAEISQVLRTRTPREMKIQIIEKVTGQPFNNEYARRHGINELVFMNGIIMGLAEEGKIKLVNGKIVPANQEADAPKPAAAPVKESLTSMLDRIISEELKVLKKNVNKA